jgi:hypothetical protein
LIISDIDIDRLVFDRQSTHNMQTAVADRPLFDVIELEIEDCSVNEVNRRLEAYPFVPGDSSDRAARCREIFSMQVGALSKKLSGAKKQKIVLVFQAGWILLWPCWQLLKQLIFWAIPELACMLTPCRDSVRPGGRNPMLPVCAGR